MTTRWRLVLASFVLVAASVGGACSDDDGDGNPEVDVPEDVDVDVDRGEDKQGD